jgi:uncharacterized protein YbjQ (UPF0145 family)
MSWFSKRPAAGSPEAAAQAAAQARSAAWEQALNHGGVPDFVTARLDATAAGKTPWLSSMTPAELLLARSHGVRPIATITGTCWFQFGRSWTEGHTQGWRTALERLIAEARECKANAVVDVKLRTSAGEGSAMDYTLIGAAIRFEGLPPAQDPVVATVPALEFVRLMEAGVLPVGIAVGAHYEWMTDMMGGVSGNYFTGNQKLNTLSAFWESVRRRAHMELRYDTARQGTGVLAHTQFGQIFKQEVDKQPDRYLGRYIVIGTVVHTQKGDKVPHGIEMVVDMRDDLSPLTNRRPAVSNAYQSNETEEAI